MSTRAAFIRGGIWGLAIGIAVLSLPIVVSLLRPGPVDPRIFSNLVLMPVFGLVLFVFGGFIGWMRALSRQAREQGRDG